VTITFRKEKELATKHNQAYTTNAAGALQTIVNHTYQTILPDNKVVYSAIYFIISFLC